MIYEDKTLILRQGLFEVQNEVGVGRSEEIYHQAYRVWLASHGVPYESKPPHEMISDGAIVHVLYPDFVVWDSITIEMKALVRRLRDEDRVQIHNYLKRRGDKLGLLVNMGLARVCVERVIHDPLDYQLSEDWRAWMSFSDGEAKETGPSLHILLHSLFQQHQTGYGNEIVEKLVVHGLRKLGLPVALNPVGTSRYQGKELGQSPLDCFVINNKILVTLTALFDENQFNIHRAKSFMECLGLNWGLAINFGKKTLEIQALAVSP